MVISVFCLVAGVLSAGILLLCLLVCGIAVSRHRAEMNAYESFIRRTYTDECRNVPVLVLRHYRAYIDKYNRARGVLPFRYFLRPEPTDDIYERFPRFRWDGGNGGQPGKRRFVKPKHNKR